MAIKVVPKVAWSEGLLMLPQHLQQSDRYHESLLTSRLEALDPLAWGVLRVELDPHALGEGLASLTAFEGIMPDGTPVCLAGDGGRPAPAARAIEGHFPAAREVLDIHLALPHERAGVSNYAANGEPLRYAVGARRLSDVSRDDPGDEVHLAWPNPLLLFGDEATDGFTTLKVAEVERDGRGQLVVSDSYVPPCLRIDASRWLVAGIERLLARMVARHRALSESRRMTGEARVEFNAADVTRYLQLHALNSMLPAAQYMAKTADVSPRTAFLWLAQLAGQLATFSPDVDMTQPLEFDFADLRTTFRKVLELNEKLLEATDTERFIACSLQEHGQSRYYGDLTDPRFEHCARFVISVEATLPRPQLVQEFTQRAKIASHDDMDIVLSTNVGGVDVAESKQPPPEVPLRPGLVYFDVPVHDNDVYWKHVWNDQNLVVWLPPSLEGAHASIKLIGTFGSR